MTLAANDFTSYFKSLNEGHEPFDWQRRLLDRILADGRWPDAIVAPTGCGKSAVVDIHVFVTALAAIGVAPRLPRRMAVVVNRRALVDKHLERAKMIADQFRGAKGVLAEVADALSALGDGETPLLCASLRGGLESTSGGRVSEWIDDPRVPAVIAATPDMWGSRLLFRGYGTSQLARPREAGLLGLDTVMILDEAHLNRQLLRTARDVATMVAADSSGLGVPALQVVETTATPAAMTEAPAEFSVVVGVEPGDLDDPAIGQRLRAPKSLTLIDMAMPTRMPPNRAYVSALASQAEALAAEVEDVDGLSSMVLCVVNNVKTAMDLAARLAQNHEPQDVVLWVGPMRPMDLDRLRAERPGLFSIKGDPNARFLVATQTVEVGVDLDCAALLTELAPRSAIIQRLGRVNRLGRRSKAPVRIVTPPETAIAKRPPYDEADLRAARIWLDRFGKSGDVGPWSLTRQKTESESVPRRFLSRLHIEHAELLARTTTDLFEEPELAFWLRDSFDESPDPVSVVLRRLLPGTQLHSSQADPAGTLRNDDLALALLEATPPGAREAYPVQLQDAHSLVQKVLNSADLSRAFVWRDDEIQQVGNSEFEGGDFQLRPGDVIVLDHVHAALGIGILAGVDATSQLNTVWGDEGVSVVFPSSDSGQLCIRLAELDAEEAQQEYTESTGRADQVVLPPPAITEAGQALPWVVIKTPEIVAGDTEVRQEWTTGQSQVQLADHAQAVADCARRWAQSLGLPSQLVSALERGGLHHDDGKQDSRFQRDRLRNEDLTVVLAKSATRSAQQLRRARGSAQLPRSWRHEQLSAGYCWSATDIGADRDLVTRLAGTSHGHGRPFFPHGAAGLMGGLYGDELADAVRTLFGTGEGWSRILSRTEGQWGVWGCAYLEAILRGADCRVSGDGS